MLMRPGSDFFYENDLNVLQTQYGKNWGLGSTSSKAKHKPGTTQARSCIKIHRCCVKHSLKQYGTNDRFPHFWRRVLSSYLLLSDVTHRSVIGRKVPCDISNGWQFKACRLYLKCKVCWLLYSILKVYSYTCIYITR